MDVIDKPMTKDKQNQEGKEAEPVFNFKNHNHCWKEDGTCYGAYASEPDGKCATRCHEDNGKKYPWCSHEIKEKIEGKEKCEGCRRGLCGSWLCTDDCHPPESRGDWREEFREKFVRTSYPFLGGQRDNFKEIDVPTEIFEMELIKKIEEFIETELTLAHTEGIEEGRKKEREVCRILICPCGCDMFIDEKGYEEAHSALQTKDK